RLWPEMAIAAAGWLCSAHSAARTGGASRRGGAWSSQLSGKTMGNRNAVMAALGVAVAVALASAPAQAQRQSAQEQRQQQMAQIPVCDKPLGTIAVIEPEDAVNWWTGQQLPAPSRLIKAFVSRSRCFTLVDRGAG